MAITKGVILGPYEILAHIGAGGMGEVWRARDKRIGRDVAVKVLPELVAGNDQVRRFEQEARAAGALNHPGLVTIFDVGTFEDSPYIVMELLEGETLRDAIGEPPAPLPLRKTIDYAIQISLALAVAHEKGIIHRDLKPENLFVTTDGRVKILDFGLAKLAKDATGKDDRSKTARRLTSRGMVVGTPGYMSPEQVGAKPLDYRTDIFSLGAVLYEMISGSRAFDRDTAMETMMAVLNEEPPPLNALPSKVPPILESIVRHCMEKSPRERFQSARDLAFDLRMLPELQKNRTDRLKALPAPRLVNLLAGFAIAVVSVLVAVGVTILRMRGSGVRQTPRTFQQLTFADGIETFPTLSPDGKTFAYVSSQSGNRDIYVQRVDGRTATNVTSESPDDDSEPAFSPDGAQIAFRSEREGGGIYVMGVTGESVRRLADFGHNPSWSSDGARIVVSTEGVELQPHVRRRDGELWIIDPHTGEKKVLVQQGVGGPDFGRDSDAVQPSWSPHGKRIAFWGVSTYPGQRDIWTIDPNAPQPKRTVVRVTSDSALHWNPVWSPDGQYLYFGSDRDGTLNLWRIPMDEASGKPTGAAEPLSLPAGVSGDFAFSQHGEMVFTTVMRSCRLIVFPFDASSGRTAAPRLLFGGSEEILTFEPSPDGKLIAFTTGGGAQEDLFIANADGTRVRRLTNDAARDRGVTWSADEKTLYFYSNRDGVYQIWSIRVDGSALTRVTDESDLKRIGARNIYLPNASSDGRMLAAQSDRSGVFIHLDRPIGQRLEPFGDSSVRAPIWSPDGKQLVVGIGVNSASGPGIGVYVPETRRFERIVGQGISPQWLPDSRHVALFEKGSIGILDLESRHLTSSAFTPPPGVDWETISPRLSKDGSTLYMRQVLEQGDIWMLRFNER
jgi:serine/threonine protein kinase/dipeptidyl aminopeptidase/acylaminoacyl peptidase